MSKSNKANEEKLNALHNSVATSLTKLLKESKGDAEMLLKVLREARGFLKDNNVSADLNQSPALKLIEASVPVEELPFDVTEAVEE